MKYRVLLEWLTGYGPIKRSLTGLSGHDVSKFRGACLFDRQFHYKNEKGEEIFINPKEATYVAIQREEQ